MDILLVVLLVIMLLLIAIVRGMCSYYIVKKIAMPHNTARLMNALLYCAFALLVIFCIRFTFS